MLPAMLLGLPTFLLRGMRAPPALLNTLSPPKFPGYASRRDDAARRAFSYSIFRRLSAPGLRHFYTIILRAI